MNHRTAPAHAPALELMLVALVLLLLARLFL